MKYNLVILLSAILLSASASLSAQTFNLKEDLDRLDAALASADSRVRSKEQLLASLDNLLEHQTTPLQRFTIYKQQFLECYPFSFDRALAAVNNEEAVAAQLGQEERDESALDKALLFTTAGFYMEAKEVLYNKVDTTKLSSDLLPMYHYIMQRFGKDYTDYIQFKEGLIEDIDYHYYRDRYLEETSPDVFWNRMICVFNLMDENRNYEADALCTKLLAELDPVSHNYAIAAYWEGVISEALGHYDARMHWYIESAVADISVAVKDNASLSSIANLLLNDDVDRASRYLQISMEDAMYYNAKLRPWQIARLFPSIEAAYKNKQAALVHRAVVIISCLAAVLLLLVAAVVALLLILRKRNSQKLALREESLRFEESQRELAEANAKLKNALLQMSEANRAKREYIALFLTMCSGYIDKLKKYLTPEQKEEEYNNFYKAFDNAFIQLYPNFVEEFNALLKPESRIVLKKDEVLNTELRIFALIRLGITQSSHIASLLRYSVNTIYNYRAQIKNSALDDRADFEEMVKKIGNVEI